MGIDRIDEIDEFIVAEGAVAAIFVFRVDALFHLHDKRVVLIHFVLFGKFIIVADPERDPGESARLVDGDAGRPVEDLGRVEDVVDLLVL